MIDDKTAIVMADELCITVVATGVVGSPPNAPIQINLQTSFA